MLKVHRHLTVEVQQEKVTPTGKKAYVKSKATISLGPLVVAVGNYGGRVDSTQALQDFKRNPHNKGRFTLNPDGYNAAKGLGLCG